MPRRPDPDVRTALVERAAQMLARREPVTLRSLVAGTGASTMAVYTHFGGMPGLWSAVRQEGFGRLAARLSAVERTDDPVRDLMALGAAYAKNALDFPDLYRAMFDAAADLEDADAADSTFAQLVECAVRAREQGRFDRDVQPLDVATRQWLFGHGVVSLVLTGVLPAASLDAHVPPMAEALFVSAGDSLETARASVRDGWATFSSAR
ncbi:TetR/AcrR family transcriptional regulator [Motilibacter deserti]|uniref:TetR/AcrR family transcriptional regulator n=1 Tax=Motilibacter deserti TaxID=2714956 RepID=A0ABX0GYJ2_9ACTN|nr:TetR/AcrR family transcriptional regulator [Motilibacter deserti]NHC15653.1 TetR/AcrR family transcriptional regulator [Motilibacter deserti]